LGEEFHGGGGWFFCLSIDLLVVGVAVVGVIVTFAVGVDE
jgi:hypothetical protein